MPKIIFSKLNLFSILFLCYTGLFSQDFTWVKGANSIDQWGVYGTMGIASPANTPGAREGAVTWKSTSGDFWLFGGNGFDGLGNYGLLCDLWKYNVTANQWVCVKGSSVIAQPTLYSTLGMSSPTGKPGGRSNCVSWADASGNLWLLGGYGYDGGTNLGHLNDLWKYTISSNEWTYMHGGSLCNQAGVYGTLGLSSPSNMPGARKGAVSWVDATGGLWLFGGAGYPNTSAAAGSLNDLWRYEPITNEWTWLNGSNTKDVNGTYGTLGTPAAANTPGARSSSGAYKDASGNFWLFGGDGWDATTTFNSGFLNDLWKYNVSTNEWTWIKGANTINAVGVYGTQGVGHASNQPGGRAGSICWIDGVGNVWLFAGEGNPGTSAPAGELNDLWKYSASANQWTWIKGNSVTDQPGLYGTQGFPFVTNIPGARSFPSNWIDASNDLWLFGGYGQAASGAPGSLNDLWKQKNCFISPVTMTITSNDSTICAGETTSLTVTGSTNYLWSDNNSTTTSYLLITPQANTTYSVYTSDGSGCKYTASFTQTVQACAGISNQSPDKFQYSIYPNPGNGVFNITVPKMADQMKLHVFNSLGQNVWEQELTFLQTQQVETKLAKGIYYYQLKQSEKTLATGKLLIE